MNTLLVVVGVLLVSLFLARFVGAHSPAHVVAASRDVPMVVEVPITACGECWDSFTLAEFAELELVFTVDDVQERACNCGHTLKLDPATHEQWFMSAEEYAQLYPHSTRAAICAERFDEVAA